MEKPSRVEEMEIMYRGEWYKIQVPIYIDPETGEEYTTTESDQDWWKSLRTQYLNRHPEALSEFTDYELKEEISGLWEATNLDTETVKDKVIVTSSYGSTPEEAIRNLYINLSI